MKRLTFVFCSLILIVCFLCSWGFHAHRRINELAVFILPADMFPFYKKHITYLSKHAVDADSRRYVNPDEAPLHYLNADHYGIHPFDSIPPTWKAAVLKYSADTLKKYGTVPWHIERMQTRLTEAFVKGDVNEIVYLSANIGHYIADAHVPLHTTENYNGQLTNQEGIHGLWESRLPELLSSQWNFFTGKAKYINNVNKEVWKIVRESFNAKDSVLSFEKQLSLTWAADNKFTYIKKGKKTVKAYSEDYAVAYNKLLNGMVKRRMRQAVFSVGSFWYTAWVNAGQPDLNKLNQTTGKDSLGINNDSLFKDTLLMDMWIRN